MDASDDAIRRREELITGHPPRVPPLTSEEAYELATERANRLRFAAVGRTDPVAREDLPEMLLTLMFHPDLYDRIAALSMEMQAKGALAHRDRELVILRTGWLCQAPYEWGEHVRLAKRVGVTGDEIERVTVGSAAEGWTAHERALLTAAEELHADAMLSDATWDALGDTLDDRQRFELTVLVGLFTAVAYFQNSLRFRLSPGNDGLQAR